MTSPAPSDPRHDALAAFAIGTLPADEHAAVLALLAESAEAREELAALRLTTDALAMAVPQVDPPPALREKVLAIAGHAPAPDVHGSLDIAAAARRARAAWMLAAASLVLAAGAGLYAIRLRATVTSLEANLDAVTQQLARAEADLGQSRTRLTRAEAGLSVLAAPDMAFVDLAGQKTAPAARARVFWTQPRGLVLTASRLPALARGRTYQLWVLADGAPVSAGLFLPDASGVVRVVLDTAVSVAAPRGMAVSVEPEGGSPQPTGDIVLAGMRRSD